MPHPGLCKDNTTSTLLDADVGRPVRVVALEGEPVVCQRLREMGFCESAQVCKIAHSGALICQVCNGRVVLSQRLGKNIIVSRAIARPQDPL